MSYYKYNFISPEPTFAIVKEELKSYFDTGAIDDLMFPIYLRKCLQKLSKGTLPIDEVPLMVEDYEARLPDNFDKVREVWACVEIAGPIFQDASSFYSQTSNGIMQIIPITATGDPCNNCAIDEAQKSESDCIDWLNDEKPVVYKQNMIHNQTYKQSYLLRPGNVAVHKHCSKDFNKYNSSQGHYPGASRGDSFDIRDNKLVTNFRNGVVHLIFYGEKVDENENQLVPDNYRILEYIELHLKAKVFEVLTHQITDETFKQMQEKLMYYKQAANEAFIMADLEMKKETIETKMRKIKRDKTRFRGYERMVADRNNNY